ncbi:MAG: hypothetical protein MI864_16545 [Pseudomonadales bacterium]|uniref:Uncharacterized protein n=1 Tax=Oleiphilus messinensis TaxID=141451 RepID=A0A1Y0I9U7_9GAMM|nr:hypothetical protein [Oleiphilus messinensis]ARU57297.1 hypothetical protein OLMES_3256 [Oleiphilus messinensis]MCG8612134.1 hypothetical protein [Pseudomonadales bacterium]
MSAPVVISIIVLIIFVSITILFIGQAREKAKIEKIRKANTLQDRYRRLKRISLDLPPQYLPRELKILLLERCIDTLNELKVIQNEKFKYASSLVEDTALLEQIKASKEKPKPQQITNEAQAKEVRTLLEALIKFIQNQSKKGFLEKSLAKKHTSFITYMASRSKADYYAAKAKEAISQNKLRIAIHNFHNAIGELEPTKSMTASQKAIQAYKIKIKELEKLADKVSKEGSEKKESMDKEWSEFMQDDDDWKKKNAYDD